MAYFYVIAKNTSPTPCMYYVFNPATNKFSVLPKPVCIKYYSTTTNFFGLAYDPIISPFYQVVCLEFLKSSRCKIQIYSSETKLWRIKGRDQEFDLFSVAFRHRSVVYWNGGIHWINAQDGNLYRVDNDQENVQLMPRPSLGEDRNSNSNNFRHYFMESQGHLFFIDFDCPEYIIYEMEKDCSKRFVKHRLDINFIVDVFPDHQLIKNKENNSTNSLLELEKFILPISVVEVKNEGPSLTMYIPGRFISYRFNDNSFKTIRYSRDTKLFHWYNTFSHMETLSFV